MEQQELKRKIAATIAATVTLCVLLGASVLLLATTQVFTTQVKILMLVCCAVLAIAIIGFLRNKIIEIRTLRLCISTGVTNDVPSNDFVSQDQQDSNETYENNEPVQQSDFENLSDTKQDNANPESDADFFMNIMQYENVSAPNAPQTDNESFTTDTQSDHIQQNTAYINTDNYAQQDFAQPQTQPPVQQYAQQDFAQPQTQPPVQSKQTAPLPFSTGQNMYNNIKNSNNTQKPKGTKIDYAEQLKQYSAQTAMSHTQQRNASVERAQQRAAEIKNNYENAYGKGGARQTVPAGSMPIVGLPTAPAVGITAKPVAKAQNTPTAFASPYAKARQIYGNLQNSQNAQPQQNIPAVPDISRQEIENELKRRSEEDQKHKASANEAMVNAKQAAERQKEAALKAEARLRALIGVSDDNSTAPVNVNTAKGDIMWEKQ